MREFLQKINDLPDDVICNIAISAEILLSKCDQASDLIVWSGIWSDGNN